jgi:alpha-1,3-mannosyltransferase
MSGLPTSLAILRTRSGQLGLVACVLIIISLLSISTSRRHTSLQLPGLLPSGGPDLSLDPPGGGQPVYRKAALTAAQAKRYAHLKRPRIPGVDEDLRFRSGSATSAYSSSGDGGRTGAKGVIKKPEGKYLFVTLTRNIEAHLPDLLNTFSVLVSFLGPSHCRFSILEGPSDDRTASILRDDFVPMLHYFGVDPEDIVLRTDAPKVQWDEVHRIQKLAELRNEAMSPLWKRGWDDTAAVVFFNDVFLRARDVLELLHQHVEAGVKEGNETGATSGMDWYQKTPEYYYDIWVGRTVRPFFHLLIQ